MNRTALHTLTNIHICPPTDQKSFVITALITQLKKEKKTSMNKKNLVMRTRTISDPSNRPLNQLYFHKKGGRSCRLSFENTLV